MSKSLQHRAYRDQPKWQLSMAYLPQKPIPKNIRANPSVIKTGKTKSKIAYRDEYDFIKKLVSRSKLGYNWKIIKPKKLGYMLVSSWEPPIQRKTGDRTT